MLLHWCLLAADGAAVGCWWGTVEEEVGRGPGVEGRRADRDKHTQQEVRSH